MKNTLLFYCFTFLFVSSSVFAISQPDFNIENPNKLTLTEDLSGIKVQSVIDLAGYRVEYEKGAPSAANLADAISGALTGVTNSLILLPVPKNTSFDFGLTVAMYRNLQQSGRIANSNVLAWVIPEDQREAALQKVPPGIGFGFHYIILPSKSLWGTNQVLLDATNQGILARRVLLGGDEQDYRGLMELIPQAASQLREGAKPIQVDLYSDFNGLRPKDLSLDEAAWNAAGQAKFVFQNHRSLLVPQLSIRTFGVLDKLLFVEDKDWLASNRGGMSFEIDAEAALRLAKNGPQGGVAGRKIYTLNERRSAARAYSEEVAWEVIKDAIRGKTGLWNYQGPLLPAIYSLQEAVIKIGPILEDYEEIRGPRVK